MNGQNRWLYLIKRMVYRFFDDGIPQSAAELSYFLLFSMFPLLMFVNSMLAQLDLSIEGMQPVLEMLPKSLQQLIGGYIQQLTGTPSFSPMIVGLGLTLYFLSRAVRSMMRTVNDIYHVEISRGMVKDVLISVRYYGGLSCFGCVQLCARCRRTNHHPRCTEISAGAAGCDGRTARCQLLGDDRVYFRVPHAVQQGRAQSAP